MFLNCYLLRCWTWDLLININGLYDRCFEFEFEFGIGIGIESSLVSLSYWSDPRDYIVLWKLCLFHWFHLHVSLVPCLYSCSNMISLRVSLLVLVLVPCFIWFIWDSMLVSLLSLLFLPSLIHSCCHFKIPFHGSRISCYCSSLVFYTFAIIWVIQDSMLARCLLLNLHSSLEVSDMCFSLLVKWIMCIIMRKPQAQIFRNVTSGR